MCSRVTSYTVKRDAASLYRGGQSCLSNRLSHSHTSAFRRRWLSCCGDHWGPKMYLVLASLLLSLLTSVSGSYNTKDPCPLGRYASSVKGYRVCKPCPRGVYGSTTGLTTSACTGPCPAGTYNDVLGATSQDDCIPCPAGTYGFGSGQTSSICSGKCPTGSYSLLVGLTSSTSCIPCDNLSFNHPNCLPKNIKRQTSTARSHAVFGVMAPDF